jgi:hypothetical protein
MSMSILTQAKRPPTRGPQLGPDEARADRGKYL